MKKDARIMTREKLERMSRENVEYWLNPGSCGKRRFDQEISFAIMMVDGGAWNVEKIVLVLDRR